MVDFAFIVCDNGFGHLRRCIAIAQKLLPARSVIYTARPQANTGGISFIEFHTNVSADALRRGDPETLWWDRRLPEIGAHIILSDNLPEILDRYPNAILQGSFLWHEAIPDAHPAYISRAQKLLARHRPIMIGLDAFAMPAVRNQTRFHPVGLYRYCPPIQTTKDSLLIAAGHGGTMVGAFQQLVKEVATQACQAGIRTVFVEPQLMPPDPPPWLQPATFDCKMFASLRAAVGRPGIGTICEVLSAGAPFFAAFEPDNLEMIHNARRLLELGCGGPFDTPAEAFAAALNHDARIPAFGPDGIEQTADFLRK